ncbi:hypothetical protein [uncultured Aquimarina sp.]|uniref:hypothetical protein n=1 Tax=uncultured Aquimarina sp. TaxID=575652 RepID=UPI002620ABFD|nr:hypothetical protein [uncultured Aquimarina sp.]
MIILRKWWLRCIVSLVLAAVLSEILFLLVGFRINSFILGLGLYIAVSIIYGFTIIGTGKKQK